MNKSKNARDCLISKSLQIIDEFDSKYLNKIVEEYSEKLKGIQSNNHNSYRDDLIKKITEEYYTFQQTANNKPLAFIKSIVYKQLFKYLHKQIHFNDYIKTIVQLFDVELKAQEKKIEVLERLLRDQFSFQQSENKNSYLKIKTLDNRLNAVYEIQKEIIIQKKRIKKSLGAKIFFSQFGEDEWLVENIDLLKKGFFVDVGAADGITFSNTYYFEKQGWTGVCFEPNPENFLLARKFRAKVEPIAITEKSGKAILKIDPASPDWSEIINRSSLKNEVTIEVVAKTLEDVIRDDNIQKIDLLSIDTEGTELNVLKSFDICSVKPKIIIVEFSSKDKGSNRIKLENFFRKLPYTQIHETKANLIYQLKE